MNSNAEDKHFQGKYSLRIRDKLVSIQEPMVMGIVNVTPDSFYSESRSLDQSSILRNVEKMILDGVAIVDVGGYSSRPGAADISENIELDRVCSAISAIHTAFPELLISVDTFRAAVAEQSILSGAAIINDISGFSMDPSIVEVAAKYGTPYVLMHMKGTPQTMQQFTKYDSVFLEIASYFSSKIAYLKSKGVHDILLDPGFGFSKTLEQNWKLFDHVQHFNNFELPMMIGVSRKSMIWKRLDTSPENALSGTTVLNTLAILKGASILRVHDVKEAKELISLLR